MVARVALVTCSVCAPDSDLARIARHGGTGEGMTAAAELPDDLAWRVAAGDFDAEVRDRLRGAFATWIETEGAVPLERCLRLPRGTASYRLMQRNRWLTEAAKAIDAGKAWPCAVRLSEELDEFLTRGPWKAWRTLRDRPEGSSDLRWALLRVAQASSKAGDEPAGLSPKHLVRIVAHLFKRQ